MCMRERMPEHHWARRISTTVSSHLHVIELDTTRVDTYAYVVPASQRGAVEQVSNVLSSSVLKLEQSGEPAKVN
jgi:hypothetical protein